MKYEYTTDEEESNKNSVSCTPKKNFEQHIASLNIIYFDISLFLYYYPKKLTSLKGQMYVMKCAKPNEMAFSISVGSHSKWNS